MKKSTALLLAAVAWYTLANRATLTRSRAMNGQQPHTTRAFGVPADCVAYAPGEYIIAIYPDGFMMEFSPDGLTATSAHYAIKEPAASER